MAASPFDDVAFPALTDLPFRAGDPPCAIWGFYESLIEPKSEAQTTVKDELGALNLLTPARILRASREEIQLGRVVSLNWPLQKPSPPRYNRREFEHKVYRWPGRHVIDDEIIMNTQSGSQWDSFRHYGHYQTGQFYNGLKESEIVDAQGQSIPLSVDKPLRNGIHTFQGKIVGRGVLLDYFSFSQARGVTYAAIKQHLITAADLDACAQAQGVTFRQGDILFVRMGYIHWYENATPEERVEATSEPIEAVGVQQAQDEIEWLWNHHFAAVACDAPAFEARPSIQKQNLHDYLLALWGTPIGELFDLEALAKTCKELGRYSFFVTSSPLNVVNGIASPPNAMAIF
ncbi:hypothetical protein K439DRAFT_1397459 [Ramaria rubella]|nr:hypothetical protein K439DRAFT_1397459 [Ramaria rubella]